MSKNANYVKGRKAEYRAIRILESLGYRATRAAGSHGMFDVWSYRQKPIDDGLPLVRLIQIKSGVKLSRADRENIQAEPVPFCCSKEVWTFVFRCPEPEIEYIH